MKACQQTDTQSIYDHGLSVYEYTSQLINYLKYGIISEEWKLCDWLILYKKQLLNSLLSEEIIKQYTIFHDCGKIYCLIIDENGKRHFPNHAEISYQTWLNIGGDQETANLIKMDMDIHTLKDKDIEEFCQRKEAITLLLVGLAEIHSNSAMFGGVNSTSFKIKWKQINKRGNAICKKLFTGEQL